jgi:hypothetical protein
MVNEKALADLGAWVDLDSRHEAAELRDRPGEKGDMEPCVKKMREPVHQDGVKPCIGENDLDRAPKATGGWVVIHASPIIAMDCFYHSNNHCSSPSFKKARDETGDKNVWTSY